MVKSLEVEVLSDRSMLCTLKRYTVEGLNVVIMTTWLVV